MSAFMVSIEHINALVSVFSAGPAQSAMTMSEWKQSVQWPFMLALFPNANPLNELGRLLIQANLTSVQARYPDSIKHPEDTPGPEDPYWTRSYIYQRPGRIPTVPEALKLLESYKYQSCEPDEWETSDVKKACDSLRTLLIHALPGYEAAPWAI